MFKSGTSAVKKAVGSRPRVQEPKKKKRNFSFGHVSVLINEKKRWGKGGRHRTSQAVENRVLKGREDQFDSQELGYSKDVWMVFGKQQKN